MNTSEAIWNALAESEARETAKRIGSKETARQNKCLAVYLGLETGTKAEYEEGEDLYCNTGVK